MIVESRFKKIVIIKAANERRKLIFVSNNVAIICCTSMLLNIGAFRWSEKKTESFYLVFPLSWRLNNHCWVNAGVRCWCHISIIVSNRWIFFIYSGLQNVVRITTTGNMCQQHWLDCFISPGIFSFSSVSDWHCVLITISNIGEFP